MSNFLKINHRPPSPNQETNMKNTTRWLLACIALASLTYGCSDDSSGGAVPSVPIPQMGDDCTSSSECPENAVCKDGKCAPKEDDTCKDGSCEIPPEKKCGDKTCSANQVCQNNRCVDKCGDDICDDGEKCQNGECVEIEVGTPCGSELCTADQSCLNGK